MRTPAAPGTPGRRVDVREWLGGIRLSGFMVIMLGLVVLGVLVLVPTVGTYLDQQSRIRALEHAVQLTQDEIDDLQAQSERWDDPAYITTQARERLYYVRPGEVVYLIDNDLSAAEQPQEQAPVSDEVEQTRTDWMAQLVRSVTAAGAAQTAAAPEPTDAPTP
jgi:cell division protein FtsB